MEISYMDYDNILRRARKQLNINNNHEEQFNKYQQNIKKLEEKKEELIRKFEEEKKLIEDKIKQEENAKNELDGNSDLNVYEGVQKVLDLVRDSEYEIIEEKEDEYFNIIMLKNHDVNYDIIECFEKIQNDAELIDIFHREDDSPKVEFDYSMGGYKFRDVEDINIQTDGDDIMEYYNCAYSRFFDDEEIWKDLLEDYTPDYDFQENANYDDIFDGGANGSGEVEYDPEVVILRFRVNKDLVASERVRSKEPKEQKEIFVRKINELRNDVKRWNILTEENIITINNILDWLSDVKLQDKSIEDSEPLGLTFLTEHNEKVIEFFDVEKDDNGLYFVEIEDNINSPKLKIKNGNITNKVNVMEWYGKDDELTYMVDNVTTWQKTLDESDLTQEYFDPESDKVIYVLFNFEEI